VPFDPEHDIAVFVNKIMPMSKRLQYFPLLKIEQNGLLEAYLLTEFHLKVMKN